MIFDTPTISLEDLRKLVEESKGYTLIDVREPNELKYGMIPSAHSIPLGKLDEALDLPPRTFEKTFKFRKPEKETMIIFHCRTGVRGGKATNIAIKKGFKNSKNFRGGVAEWSKIDPKVKMYYL